MIPQSKSLRVLIIEDSEDDALLIVHELRRGGYEPEWRRVETPEDMGAALREQAWDVVLADYKMPRFSAPAALGLLQDTGQDLPFIVISGKVGEDVAVEVMKAGAHDFFAKGSLIRLLPSIQREMGEAENRRRRREAEKERDRALERERHLNAVLRSIRDVNQLIVREKQRGPLIEAACGSLVSTRGFRGAWIVLTDRLPDELQSAQNGFPDEALRVLGDQIREGRLPICCKRATSEGGVVAIGNPVRECDDCPLSRYHNGTAGLIIALVRNGREFGFMGVSVPVECTNDEQERSLLSEIADDIAFALSGMDVEAQRVKSERTIRAIFKSASDGILLAEIESGRFVLGNEAICRMLGYSAEEIKGLSLADIHPIESLDHVRSQFEKQARGEVTSAEGMPMRRRDGTVFPADVSSAPLELEGRRHLVGIFRDITGRKQREEEKSSLEDQLRQAQKVEAIGQLAGGVAHDFNNALTVIMSHADMVLMDMDSNHPFYRDLEQIKKASQKAANLTRQLLAFSRKQILQPEILDLNEIVRGLKKMLGRLIHENIELNMDLAPDLGPIEADPGQLEQVIINLAVNARDAMPDGGKLTIETKNVELDEDYAIRQVAIKPGLYVMMAVTDTGAGMTKEVQERIFEPFFTTKEEGKGTGLGLSTVYGIVKQSRGNIYVYSEPGMGTTFKIYLPRQESTAVERKEATEAIRSSKGTETILTVEDDEILRNVVVKTLSKDGYRVLTAASGEEALGICREHREPIHLLLTDMIMPGMSGKKLAGKAKELRPDLKVLFMSGYADSSIVKNGILEKGTAFIQKPFTGRELTVQVRKTLEGEL